MITRTFISTISYNTEQFLIRELNKLIASRLIEFWAFLHHLKEDDETKEHKHLFVIPACSIDTFELNKRLEQIDVAHPDLPPLGCIHWVHSKFSDWYLYCLHDKDYLATKAESRRFHYERHDFVVSDVDRFSELIHTSDFSKYKSFARFRDAVQSGVGFRDLFINGFVPVQQIIPWKKAYNLLKYGEMDYDFTCRGGRIGHENGEEYMPFKVNADGEIVGDYDALPEDS